MANFYNPYFNPYPNNGQYPQYSQYPQYPNRSGLNWAQGETGAKAFPTQPNTSDVIFDSESPRFFIKTVDASGVPMPLRKFKFYEEIEQPAQKISQDESSQNAKEEYLTKAEFESKIDELMRSIRRISDRQPQKNNNRREENDQNAKSSV